MQRLPLPACACAALALFACQVPEAGSDEDVATEAQVPALAGGMQASYPDERTVVLERDFQVEAPAVFAANTREDLLKGWYPPEGWSLASSEVDARPGGSYRNEMRDGGEGVFVIYGEFSEVEFPTRVVFSESYEGYDWAPLDVIVDIEPTSHSSCHVKLTVIHPSAEIHELNSPMMVPAAAEAFERMEKFLLRLMSEGH
jgi:uncharacterized protein YndB with AHSA1/START domain